MPGGRSSKETVVHIMGALRAPTTGDLLERVESLLDRGEQRIAVSLADVWDLDAAGVGALVGARNLAEAAGGRFRILDDAGWTRVMLARTGLLRLLKTGHC